MSTGVDTTHTTRQQLEKIGLLIEHCQLYADALATLSTPNGPGEVRGLLNKLLLDAGTLKQFADEAESCLKALVIKDFIETVDIGDCTGEGRGDTWEFGDD